MDCFPTPSYFVQNLRTNNYDNSSTIFAPLIPQSRQQIVFHIAQTDSTQPFNPIHVGDTFGITESSSGDLQLYDAGSIFDPNVFYPPYNIPSWKNPITTEINVSPLASIYNTLQTQNNIFLI